MAAAVGVNLAPAPALRTLDPPVRPIDAVNLGRFGSARSTFGRLVIED